MTKCVIPGTFDPMHSGHLSVVIRASKLFDQVVVAVAESSLKNPKYSLDERIRLAKVLCIDLTNVEVKGFSNLLVDFVKQENAICVVKGLRNQEDFEYESNMNAINKSLSKDFETVFLLSDPDKINISSTIIRELEANGIDPKQITS